MGIKTAKGRFAIIQFVSRTFGAGLPEVNPNVRKFWACGAGRDRLPWLAAGLSRHHVRRPIVQLAQLRYARNEHARTKGSSLSSVDLYGALRKRPARRFLERFVAGEAYFTCRPPHCRRPFGAIRSAIFNAGGRSCQPDRCGLSSMRHGNEGASKRIAFLRSARDRRALIREEGIAGGAERGCRCSAREIGSPAPGHPQNAPKSTHRLPG